MGGGVDGNRDELFRRSPRPKGDFSSRAREVVSWLLWKQRAGGGGAPRTQTPDPDPSLSHKRYVKEAPGEKRPEGETELVPEGPQLSREGAASSGSAGTASGRL